jgi:tetratricopeptide (TPR) repeat protein
MMWGILFSAAILCLQEDPVSLEADASSKVRAGLYLEAEPLYLKAIALLEAEGRARSSDYAATLANYGLLKSHSGQLIEAERLQRRALTIAEALNQPNRAWAASIEVSLAATYVGLSRLGLAEKSLQHAIPILSKAPGGESDLAAGLNHLGDLYRRQRRYEASEDAYRRSLEVKERSLRLGDPRAAATMVSLAALWRERGCLAEAEPMLRRALAIEETAFGSTHPSVAVALHELAWVLLLRRDYAGAEPAARRAIAIFEATSGTGSINLAAATEIYALILRKTGRTKEARRLDERAHAIRAANPAAQTVDYRDLLKGIR